MIEMSVSGIGLDAINSQPIVILNDHDNIRALPIWIGKAEARAISLALENIKSPRPLTHDLFLNLIEEFGYAVQQVEIDALESSTYRATVRLLPIGSEPSEQNVKSLDARPSDAIAIALASAAPILVSSEVMDKGSFIVAQAIDEVDTAEFKKFLRGVRASDFKLPEIKKPGKDRESLPDKGELSTDAEPDNPDSTPEGEDSPGP